MTDTLTYHAPNGHTLFFQVEGKKYQTDHQYLTGLQIKEIAGLTKESELFLTNCSPWKDEPISNDQKIDLARPGLEGFYIKKKLKYCIEGKEYETDRQYILGKQIREQGKIPEDHQIFLAIHGPYEDELILDGERVDLARPGLENFYSKKISVVLIVNGTPKSWNKIKISFKEVIILAYGNYIDSPTMVYTVGYEDGPKINPEGSMTKDSSVYIKNKMIFHATATDKS